MNRCSRLRLARRSALPWREPSCFGTTVRYDNGWIELLASYGWRQLYVAGDVTLQDTQLNDPTAPELQRRPEYTPWISGSGTVSGPVGFGIKGRARVFHQGAQYCVNPDSGADEKLSAQAWLNLEISRAFSLRDSGAGRLLGLVLSLDNATDAEAFDQCGLPRPGRLLRLGLRVY